MSDSSALPKSCPQCGAALPYDATEGLCPRCLMAEAMQPSQVAAEDAMSAATVPVARPQSSQPRHESPDLPLPEELTALLPKGDYRVESFLGQGGMGAVYKGVQVRLKRPVAIKIMRRDQGRDYDFEARFEREALAMAKLNHPNIVSVIDYGEAGPDYLYIVMELVDGADLMDVIRTGRMTQEMALTLLPQICDALQFAHDHGIVHRDIKPSNIMLTRDGRIKMADFGLAKRYDAESSFRTQTGTGMGTPDYAAPEQFDAHAQIDHRADIYALGVMIYQMITGELPRGVWRPPSQRVPVVPEWDDIVSHAMQADPANRYQQASEIKTDVSKIKPWSGDIPVANQTSKSSAPQAPHLGAKNVATHSNSRAPLIFVLILALVGLFAWFEGRQGKSIVRQTIRSPNSAEDDGWKNAINLLSLIDPTKDAEHGKATMVNGELVGQHDTQFILKLPYQPPTEYDFRISFTPVGEKGPETWQMLCSFGRPFAYRLGARGDHDLFGFTLVDGKELAKGAAKILPPLESGRRYTSTVRVRKDGITTYLDGDEVVHWKTDSTGLYELSEDKLSELSDDRCLGVGCWLSGAVFHSIEVREITGKGKLLGGSPGVNSLPLPSSPSSATKDAPFTNTLGMKFVPVPGTTLLFSIWDTRVMDYEKYAAAKPGVDVSWKTQQKDGVPVGREPDHPVVGVNWDDAQAFCTWLTEKETTAGTLPKGAKYRLPTDAEWSRAVGLPPEQGETPAAKRQKNTVDFPWGIDFPPKTKVGNYADVTFHEKFPKAPEPWMAAYTDDFATTSPVGSFPANAFGLYDMGGNVWQWCEDWYDASQKQGVIRGASWYDVARADLLAARRYGVERSSRVRGNAGFRPVLEPAPSAAAAPSNAHSVVAKTTDESWEKNKRVSFDPVSVCSAPGSQAPTSSSTPATATKVTPFVNTLGMKFVPVPITGGPTDKQRVLFSVWETRVQDYVAFTKETSREWQREGMGFPQGPDHPAVKVSWDDAQAFCAWLNERERKGGKLGASERYRLPSDHEWSCAAGIGDKEAAFLTPVQKNGKLINRFAWGTTWPPTSAVENFSGMEAEGHKTWDGQQFIEGYRDAFTATASVGSFTASAYGLYDVGGNVREWSMDDYDASQGTKTWRGASFRDSQRSALELSYRSGLPPSNRDVMIGFRVVLSPSAH